MWVSGLGAWETTGTKPGGGWVWRGGSDGGEAGLRAGCLGSALLPPALSPTVGKAAGQPALPGGSGPVSQCQRDIQGAAQGQGASIPGKPPPGLGLGAAEALVTLRLTFLSVHVAPTGRDSCRQGPDQLCSQGGTILHQALLDSCLVLLSFPGLSGQLALWAPRHESLEAASRQRLFEWGVGLCKDGTGPDETADREGAPAVPV